jgi:hypothetical protein
MGSAIGTHLPASGIIPAGPLWPDQDVVIVR